MRYGHGPGGIVGIMLNEHALCRWALIPIEPPYLFETDKGHYLLERATLFEVHVGHHKEEAPSIIKTDDDDRNAIRDKLDACVDPLDVSQCQNIINIVIVKISNKNVNVEDAVQIGEAQLQEFELFSQDSTKRSRGRLLP